MIYSTYFFCACMKYYIAIWYEFDKYNAPLFILCDCNFIKYFCCENDVEIIKYSHFFFIGKKHTRVKKREAKKNTMN